MAYYRMKHIPTGLYYRPVREVKIERQGTQYYVKSNLHKVGRIYNMIPSLGWVGPSFKSHLWTDGDFGAIYSRAQARNPHYEKEVPFVFSEWVVEEYVKPPKAKKQRMYPEDLVRAALHEVHANWHCCELAAPLHPDDAKRGLKVGQLCDDCLAAIDSAFMIMNFQMKQREQK